MTQVVRSKIIFKNECLWLGLIWDHRVCCIVDEAYVSIPYMYYHTFVFILQVPKATDGQVRDTGGPE